jgi:hypothetical protein
MDNMKTGDAPDLRYPVGRYQPPASITAEHRQEWIDTLAHTPAKLRSAVKELAGEQLDTPYRPGGWTIRQVVHHFPDSHMNSYMRFRLALTEDEPVIKPYHENLWAELTDAQTAPIEASLELFDGLHRRWVALLSKLTPEQFQRTFRHPEIGVRNLEWTLGLYDWHCRHHLAHIENTRERLGWR